MLSILGLVGGLALLIWLTVRGVNILVAGPVAAFLVAITSNITLLPPCRWRCPQFRQRLYGRLCLIPFRLVFNVFAGRDFWRNHGCQWRRRKCRPLDHAEIR